MQYNIEELLSKTGEKIVKVNDYFLHSKYDPKKEAKLFVENMYELNKHILLFGHGRGYITDLLIDKLTDGQKMVIIEPVFEDIDIKKENVIVLRLKELSSQALLSIFGMITEVKLICAPNYNKACAGDYAQTLEIFRNYLLSRNVSNATIKHQALLWNLNYLENLRNVIDDQTLEKLSQTFNCPIVIASGGPSLTKQLPLLKEKMNNCIIIASGSTVNSLLAADIIPDIVVSIDGTELNYNHFKELSLENSVFIYQLQSYPEIRPHFKSKGYYFIGSIFSHMKKHLNYISNDELVELKGGGSVAHFALTVARYISNGPITLIGQDLAYTNNETHAANNKHMKIVTEDESKGNFVETEGYYGDRVSTNYVFMTMKESFERIIKQLPLAETVYNSTEGGVLIKGIQNMSFTNFVEAFLTKPIQKQALYQKNEKSPLLKQQQNENLKTLLSTELKKYNQLVYLLKENLHLLKKNKLESRYDNHILDKLNKNDKKIEKIVGETSLYIAAQIVQLEVLTKFKEGKNENDFEKFTRINNQNLYLYNALDDITKIISDKTKELLEKL